MPQNEKRCLRQLKRGRKRTNGKRLRTFNADTFIRDIKATEISVTPKEIGINTNFGGLPYLRKTTTPAKSASLVEGNSPRITLNSGPTFPNFAMTFPMESRSANTATIAITD